MTDGKCGFNPQARFAPRWFLAGRETGYFSLNLPDSRPVEFLRGAKRGYEH